MSQELRRSALGGAAAERVGQPVAPRRRCVGEPEVDQPADDQSIAAARPELDEPDTGVSSRLGSALM